MDNHVLHVFMDREYPKMVKGEGIYLYQDDGTKWIDSSGGPLLVSLGYGNEEIAQAAYTQLKTLGYVNRFFTTTAELEEACAAISEISGGVIDRIFTVSGGTEAVEVAIKLAKTYQVNAGRPTKYKILGRWLSYHGMSNAALSIGGNLQRREVYSQYLTEYGHVAPAYCYRCPFGMEPGSCKLQCADDLERQILMQGPDTVAAFIAEPVSGTSLCAAHPLNEGYFKRIREICDKYDVAMILDEVMCGVGRTGEWFAFQGYGVEPDIVAMGKAISGGYFPVGATGCTRKIYETIQNNSATFGCGFTWAGNPSAAAVIKKTLKYTMDHNLLENVRTQGAYLMQLFENLRDKHPTIGDVRGKGLQCGMEFVKDKETGEPLPEAAHYYAQLIYACLDRHMLIQFGNGQVDGRRGDMAMIGPPFITTKAEIDLIVDTLDDAITEIEKKNGF